MNDVFCPRCFGVESDSCDVCLSEKIATLKAQIEKMKCCFNCRHYSTGNPECRTCGDAFAYSNWELTP